MVYVPVHTAPAAGRQRLIRRLRKAGARSESSAQPLETKSRLEEKALARALKCGLIREAAGGGYYVDEDKVAASRARELRYIGIGFLFMFLIIGILYVLGEFP